MNPNQPPQMPRQQMQQAQQQQFNPTHNHMYETLRKYLMQLHAQGLPGIDQVIHALNKAHVTQMGQGGASSGIGGQLGAMGATPASIGRGTGQAFGQGVNMNQLPPDVQSFWNQASPQLPQQGGY